MSMLEPDFARDKPSWFAVKRMWWSVSFELLPVQDESIEKLLDAYRRVFVNGGALLGRFRISESRTFDYFASRGRLDEIDFFERFLTSDAVSTALPDLRLGDGLADDPGFSRQRPLLFEASLATHFFDGAYIDFDGSHADAKRLAEGFTATTFDARYDEIDVYQSGAQWSDWFEWLRSSWIVIDKRTRTVWLLCTTDTD
jgi:hypothetical protein